MSPGTNLDEELLSAAKESDAAGVGKALKAGANVDAVDPGGRSSLMHATMKGRLDVMRVLLEAGAGVNLSAALGETALIIAASGRASDTVPILLEHHADPTISDRDKKTVLMWVVDLQFHRGGVPVDVIAPLVTAGAEPNAKDKFGRSALMWAVKGDLSSSVRPAVLKALLDNGVEATLRDDRGETALFGLVRYVVDVLDLDEGPTCIELLLAAGVDPKVRNKDDKTALGVVDSRNTRAIKALKKLGLEK